MTSPALPPVEEVVPHRPPMLMLDRIVAYDPAREHVVCAASVGAESPFVSEGRASGVALLEVMAQAAAVVAGMSDRAGGEAPKQGFVIAVRELALDVAEARPGEALDAIAERDGGDHDLARFRCRVERDGRTIAEAEITVMRGMLPDGASR